MLLVFVFVFRFEEPAVFDGIGAVVVLPLLADTDVLEACIVVAVCEGAP